jgi:hypothetical protein
MCAPSVGVDTRSLSVVHPGSRPWSHQPVTSMSTIVDNIREAVERPKVAGSCLLGIRRTPPVRVSPVSQNLTLRYEPIISAEWQLRVDSNPHL